MLSWVAHDILYSGVPVVIIVLFLTVFYLNMFVSSFLLGIFFQIKDSRSFVVCREEEELRWYSALW